MNLPDRPGFYWAQWRVSDDCVERAHDYTPSHRWEVVWVDTPYDDDSPEKLMCEIPGVPGQHTLEGFVWHGSPPLPLPSPPNKVFGSERDRLTSEEAYRLYKKMTPDQRIEYFQKQIRGTK